jgi:hypothetical protein
MNRNTTVLTLCGLLIAADAFTMIRTIDVRPNFIVAAILFETGAAVGLAWVAVEALRKIYRRQKKPASRSRFGIVQPLRRLFVSVWS